MYRACIAVVDAARARLFTFQRSSEADGMKEQLIEQRDLVNPSRRLRPSELFTESRPPSQRSGDLQFTIDDHRDEHIAAFDAEFARRAMSDLFEIARAFGATQAIVCASPRMLGRLRAHSRLLTREGLDVAELDRDLGRLTPSQLRQRLASYGLLPSLGRSDRYQEAR